VSKFSQRRIASFDFRAVTPRLRKFGQGKRLTSVEISFYEFMAVINPLMKIFGEF
jgi:hypothetical protein